MIGIILLYRMHQKSAPETVWEPSYTHFSKWKRTLPLMAPYQQQKGRKVSLVDAILHESHNSDGFPAPQTTLRQASTQTKVFVPFAAGDRFVYSCGNELLAGTHLEGLERVPVRLRLRHVRQV